MTNRQPSMATLMAALPEIRNAPSDHGPIRYLCHRPDFGQRDFVSELTLTVEQGIPGERWMRHPWMRLPDGSPDPAIQVSILPARVCDLVWQPGDVSPHPGDSIVADLETSLDNLPTGSLIGAGDAVLQVSAVFNDACVKWRKRYGEDALRWVRAEGHPHLRLRGILCAITQDGVVRADDRLRVLRRGY
ncbi:MOSC domain-containing protein [Paracoccus onubensis]|uniref:MOSC domain-containing protein n=1 Tax=Paracoccus onubensis TaxID=1675788 RepID=A0A418SZX9_9RHOB|nr:hypothetical protein [Paracoccus onubensis]RJE86521.1 hypothetical protein D3P04_07305 [Paracoccus onubensis]